MPYSTQHAELRKVFKYFPDESYSIDKRDSFQKIVKGPAYRDFTPRTLKGLKKEQVDDALNWLSNRLFDYFHSDHCDFDKWHIETCEEFCTRFQKGFPKGIPYGKAQKIVNMSLKYIHCFSDSDKYAPKFAQCHMALDQYTIEWFIRCVLGEDKPKSISVTEIRETSWSKLVRGNNENEVYSYLWFQDQIRKYLGNGEHSYKDDRNTSLSPFMAEFYIWPEVQLHLAVESLYAHGDDRETKQYKGKSLKEKLKLLKNYIETIEASLE